MIVSAVYTNEEQTLVKVTYSNGIVSSVPIEKGNSQYYELMQWTGQGNMIEPYHAPTIRVTSVEPEEFFDRFTEAEQDAVIEDTYIDKQTKKFYDRMIMQRTVDLESPKLVKGMDYLVSKGLITPTRKAEILTIEEKTV